MENGGGSLLIHPRGWTSGFCGGGPTHDDQRDVIARYDIAEEVSHDVAGDAVGSIRCDRVLQTLEADIERFASALDEPVGVERDDGTGREGDGRRAAWRSQA